MFNTIVSANSTENITDFDHRKIPITHSLQFNFSFLCTLNYPTTNGFHPFSGVKKWIIALQQVKEVNALLPMYTSELCVLTLNVHNVADRLQRST